MKPKDSASNHAKVDFNEEVDEIKLRLNQSKGKSMNKLVAKKSQDVLVEAVNSDAPTALIAPADYDHLFMVKLFVLNA